MSMKIRPFRADDIDFAVSQTSREGWDTTAAIFDVCLAHDPDGCFIAEVENRRVAMITTTCYARSAWVGNLIVTPECRRQGIGEALMTHAMNQLWRQSIGTIQLEGDPMGVRIYRRLGFVNRFESLRFRRDPPHSSDRPVATHLQKRHLDTVAALDRTCFGDDRRRLLAMLYELSCGAYLIRVNGRVEGYALAMHSAGGVRLGPGVATDAAAASWLLDSVLSDFPDTAVIVGVPSVSRATVAVLEEHGFIAEPSSLRMQWGVKEAEGDASKLVAVANGAMG